MNEISTTLEKNGLKVVNVISSTPHCTVLRVFSCKYKTDFVAKVLNINSAEFAYNIQTFNTEVSTLTKVYHPNIISFYRQFIDEKNLYIILEYCHGGSTLDYIRTNNSVDENLLLDWMKQSVEALFNCHIRGITHRDIKPSNLLLDKQNRIKLADFGLSYVGEKNQRSMRFGGSIPFCAPELLRGKRYDPFKADVWSLGMTFYLLAFNNLPYDASTEAELIDQILEASFEVPEKESCPEISEMIRKMLKKNPEERITCEDIISNKLLNRNYPSSKHSQLPKLTKRIVSHSSQFMTIKSLPIKGSVVCSKPFFNSSRLHSVKKE